LIRTREDVTLSNYAVRYFVRKPSMRVRAVLPPVALLSLVLPLALAGCGGGEAPPPQVFPALNYAYLTPLRLNVATLDVEDHTAALSPNDLSAQAPTPPAAALTQMAHDRLVPSGNSGRAVFVITEAAITQDGAALNGRMAVHLDVVNAQDMRVAYAEARVSRQATVPEGQTQRAALYALTRQMMNDMNVEFEYQARRSLGRWLLPSGMAPAPVQAQPLPGSPVPAPVAPPAAAAPAAPAAPNVAPGGPVSLAPAVPPTPGTPGTVPGAAPGPALGAAPGAPAGTTPRAAPSGATPSGGAPVMMSPPPGYLTPPPSARPVPVAPSAPSGSAYIPPNFSPPPAASSPVPEGYTPPDYTPPSGSSLVPSSPGALPPAQPY
jgi:hypothetical protein